MTCQHHLIILSLILPLPSYVIAAQLASKSVSDDHQDAKIVQSTSFEGTETSITNLRPLKPLSTSATHHRHFLARNAHGVLNIIGWGTLLPIGAMIARYFRDIPMKHEQWYPLHIMCQTSGYLIGSLGWGIGLWLGNSSKQYMFKTHRILGILVFTLSTIQMLAVFLQPRINDEWRKCWVIYHQLLGFALIGLSVANIFQGVTHQTHVERWKWTYVGLLVILALVALPLEAFRWIFKSRFQHQMPFDDHHLHTIS